MAALLAAEPVFPGTSIGASFLALLIAALPRLSRWARNKWRPWLAAALVLAATLTILHGPDPQRWLGYAWLAPIPLIYSPLAAALRNRRTPYRPDPALPPPAAADLRQMEACLQCGLCVDACEVVGFYGEDRFAPQGKIAGWRDRIAGPLDKVGTNLYKTGVYVCTDCGDCERACPTGIGTVELMARMKQDLAAANRYPPGLAISRAKLLATGNPFGAPAELRHAALEDLADPSAPAALFVGCHAAYSPILTDMARAVLRSRPLRLLAGETCSGYPLWTAGFASDARAFVERNRAAAAGVSEVVFLCSRCYGMWNRFPGAPRAVYYADGLAVRAPDGALFHPPHALDVPTPEGALRLNTPSCGAGGDLELFAPDLAGHFAGQVLDAARGRPVLTACARCRWALGRLGRGPVLDIAELAHGR